MIKKISKILAISFIPVAVSISTVTSAVVDKTTTNILNSNKESDLSTYNASTETVNWLNTTDKPTNFNDSVPVAQTDSSPAITTDFGVMGIRSTSNKKTMMFMMSYSGVLLWWQMFSKNPFLVSFYKEKSMDITNLEVQQFAYLKNKQAIVVLLGNGNVNNQSIIILDAKTGLLWNPTTDSDNVVTKAPIYRIKELMSSAVDELDRMYVSSNDTVIINKFGDYDTYKNSIKVTLNTNISNSTVTGVELKDLGNQNTKDTLIALYNLENGKTAALTRKNTAVSNSDPNGQKTYEQSIRVFDSSAITTNVGSQANVNNITDKYIEEEAGNSYVNFSYVDGNNFYVLLGNNTTRKLQKFTLNGNKLTPSTSVDLSNYEINTITVDTNNKIIYVGNKKSKDNITAGYINLSSSTLSFQEIFRTSSSDNFRPYYIIPVLERRGNNSQQYALYLNSSNQLTYVYKSSNQTKFDPSDKIFSISGLNDGLWTKIKNKGDAIFKNKMASAVAYNDISSAVGFSNYSQGKFDVGFKNTSNNDNGTLTITLTISYPWMFDTSQKSSFEIPLNFNGFYKMSENFKFQFVTSNTINAQKWSEIEKLKKSKFAKSVTQEEVFNNFWTGTIKNKDGGEIEITKDMFSLSSSKDYGTLDVTFTVPSNQVPQGYPKITNKQSFTGFLSTNGYETTAKSDADINKLIQDIFPSQLTKENILNFITIGENIKKELTYWDIQITDVDDFLGTATISAKYLYENDSSLPDRDNFPVDRFTIFESKKLTSFKNIDSQLGQKPTMDHLDSDYLPSEIWEQYLNYKNGQTDQSILLDNLTLSITDKNSVDLVLLNPDSCDADKFLNLQINFKDGNVLNVDYTGTQYQKNIDNKLLFNETLKSKLTEAKPDFYPFIVKWEITTKDKAFEVLGPNGTYIQQSNNIYYINVRDLPNDQDYLLSKNQYANEITEETVSKLIQVQGYTYDYLEYKVDNNKGSITAVIRLNTLNSNNPGNGDNSDDNNQDNLPDNGDGENNDQENGEITLKSSRVVNNNYIRTIYIYNFRLPLPGYVNILTFTIIGTVAACAVGAGLWYLIWKRKKIKYNKMGIDINQQMINRKKMMLLKRKIELTERIKDKSNSPSKRKRK